MSKNVVVIGGGIIGLCSAYYLQKEGHQVTVIDKSNFTEGASYVNAGYITPSHFIPLAAPGIITKGLKWMLNSSSPFYVKPRLDLDFLKWSWAFKKSANSKQVETAIKPLIDINFFSRDLYAEMKSSKDFDFHFERNGLLMLYQTDKVGEEEWLIGKRGIAEGLNAKLLSAKEVYNMQPNANLSVKGAVYYDCDAHMTPSAFMPKMIAYLASKGVKFIDETQVTGFRVSSNVIKNVNTTVSELDVDEAVLCAGTWSPTLAKQLGINMSLQAGKGYSINAKQDSGITMPAILSEAKIAVTPMDGFTRFAGTMEFSGINKEINPVRVTAIAKAAERYYQDLNITSKEKDNATSGLRPCSPDGLPYIGKSSKCKNLTIATGHAMMGWSLGPATGKLVSEIISDKKTSLNIELYTPDRKI